MNHRECPSVEQLKGMLDPLAIIETSMAQHLTECTDCRQTLEMTAGASTWWDEARLHLQVEADPAIDRIAHSICALADHTSDSNLDPLHEIELEQFQHLLDPPSHPELLGKLQRYELEQLVGRGGMGLVFRAHDSELHRVVAVKTLAMHLIPIGAARQRFVREGRAAASLAHPHIVPVFDVIIDGPVPALVMQFIPGPTLENWLDTHGPMAWPQVLTLAIQISDALSAAHASGLVHRDIKPGNILLEAEASRALITDFGLVRTLDDATLTRSGMLAGTPDYMSPEQALGRPIDLRSDLFSLGSLLYTMLSGHPPFRAANPMSVLNRISYEPHRRLIEMQPDVPIELSCLIDRLLSKSPSRRPGSAADVKLQLQELKQSPLRLKGSRAISARSIAIASLCVLATTIGWLTWPASESSTPKEQATTLSTATAEPSHTAKGTGVADQILDEIVQTDTRLDHIRSQSEKLAEETEAPDVKKIAAPSNQLFQKLDHQLDRTRQRIQDLKVDVQ